MMPLIRAAVLGVSGSLAAWIAAKATLAAALGLAGAWWARGNRAAVRHALLAATFGVLLLLPVVSLVAPPVLIAVPAARERAVPGREGRAGAIRPAAAAHTTVGATPAGPPTAGLSPEALWLMGWMAGTALFLLPVGMGVWQVRRLRRSALPWPQGQSMVDRLVREAGLRGRVEVLLHEALAGPMTCGVVHPAIVLSGDAQSWEAEDLNRALVHELEHVRRGDWVSHCAARAVCAMYWFHPLVWMAWGRLSLEAERSCDDAVVGRSEAAAYADQLVGIARRLSLAGRTAGAKPPLLAMANRADLAKRVGAVLDSGQRRGRAGRLAVGLACGAALLVLAMSPLRVVAAPQAGAADAAGARLRLFVSTELVVVQAVVTDRNGNPIEGLSANDFTLTEDGAPEDITVFEFQKLDAAPEGPGKSYYILGYYRQNLTADGKFRKLVLTCKADNAARLNYRAGYYARGANDFGAASAGRVVESGAALDIQPPVLLRKVEPAYSEEARKAKYQGTVMLQVEIGESGDVTRIKVMRSLGLGLDEKAIEALKQWKFRPGMKDARPVAVEAEVMVSFRLL